MKINRRSLLKATAAATLTPHFPAVSQPAAAETFVYPENGTLIPDEGWHLWVDQQAQWKDDDIFLPEDVAWKNGKLCGAGKPLPMNQPTGGWDVLSQDKGIGVILPTSVEQHFWGKFGSRPYTPEEYRYAANTHGGTQPATPPADDNVPQNGAYFGVSWFSRPIEIPENMRGKRILLHVRGAHLRAEVYLNGKLCGYSIMEELPFEADLTDAANHGGKNLLAIRITNPFGRFDWVDGLNAKWHNVLLYRSHGFGALDRGLTISTHAPEVRIADAWVLNTPEKQTIRVFARVLLGNDTDGDAGALAKGLKLELMDERGHVVPAQVSSVETLKTNEPGVLLSCSLTKRDARIWDLDSPHLYTVKLTQTVGNKSDSRTLAFGFRWFAPEGIGKIGSDANALFRLNGRRIKLYTAISWGYWGLNGMFPVPELAEKEVTAAKTLGLNCLNFHRNLAKTDVLRVQDQRGLLRYMEPGAGKLAIGRNPPKVAPNAPSVVPERPQTEAEKFAQRYMFTKCVEMVKTHRSHPSVIEYCLQNELGADLKNPATLAVLRAMHEQDPSRLVVLNDGFVARGAAQAWFAPWNADGSSGMLHRSDEEKWGDWWNNHQGAGDQWYDQFYKSPTEFTYKAPYREILTEYGEMEGCARPDIHGLMIHQITETYRKYGGDSYDLKDHEEILAGYNKFLDQWGFRKAYPTADHVFRAVGRTCYESWMNYMENARIADDLDFAAISGWESTAIENHSGIVDNLRNFKSDPKLIGDTLRPVRPIAKQRSLVIEQGKPATFDLYFANDTTQPVTGELVFALVTPSGRKQELVRLPAPPHVKDTFCTLLREGFDTPALTETGLYRFRFTLASDPAGTQTKEIWVTGVPAAKASRKITIGVSGLQAASRKQFDELASLIGATVKDFASGERFDLIISAGWTKRAKMDGQIGETTGEQMPVMKPGHKPEPGEVPEPTVLGQLQDGILEAVRNGTPLFAIPQADTLAQGVAQDLAKAGAFTYNGEVGDFRAPWMGNWYFNRAHALFEGMPVDQGMGGFYQAKGRQSNGLRVEGPNVEVLVGYSRDHDRHVGAGTFLTRLGRGKIVFHRCPDFQPVMQRRFLANVVRWLTA